MTQLLWSTELGEALSALVFVLALKSVPNLGQLAIDTVKLFWEGVRLVGIKSIVECKELVLIGHEALEPITFHLVLLLSQRGEDETEHATL